MPSWSPQYTYIEWLLVLACLVNQYSEIRYLVFSLVPFLVGIPPICLQFLFRSSLGSLPVWSEGSCLHVRQQQLFCNLHIKITFLGKWDEHVARPFLWPLTSFPDRRTYSVHSVQYCLSSCFEQFCGNFIRTCGFATCCLADGTSNLWTKWWRLLLPILLLISFPYKSSRYP